MTQDKSAVETIYHVEDGGITFERRQDCQPILDEIQKIKQVTDGRSKSGDLVHIGRIPKGIIEAYCNERGVSFHEFITDDIHVTRLMNDSDYKHLRIWEGRA